MAVPSNTLHETVKQHPWEAAHEWEARIKFVEDNHERYGLKKAIRLSIVWANIHFLGCSYPPNTEALVRSYPLPDRATLEDRARVRKRRLDVTDSDQSEAKRSKPNSESSRTVAAPPIPVDPALANQVAALISSVRQAQESSSLSPRQENDHPYGSSSPPLHPLLERIGERVCVCEQCIPIDRVQNSLGALEKAFGQYGRIFKEFSYAWEFPEPSRFSGPGGMKYKCLLLLNDTVVAEEEQPSKKNIKGQLAASVLKGIAEYRIRKNLVCPRVGMKVGSVTREEITGKKTAEPSIPESNKGNQLLRKMGWNQSEGLGKEGRVSEPITVGVPDGRRLGLGAGQAESGLDAESIRHRLQEFVRSDQVELTFPTNLSSDERAQVHRLSVQFGLGHRSQGQGNDRHIVVSKPNGPGPYPSNGTTTGDGQPPLKHSAFFAPAFHKVYGNGYGY